MATTDERIERVHDRVTEIKRRRKRRILGIEGAVTGVLGICLVVTLILQGVNSTETTERVDVVSGYVGSLISGASSHTRFIVISTVFLLLIAAAVLILTYRAYRKEFKKDQPDGEE